MAGTFAAALAAQQTKPQWGQTAPLAETSPFRARTSIPTDVDGAELIPGWVYLAKQPGATAADPNQVATVNVVGYDGDVLIYKDAHGTLHRFPPTEVAKTAFTKTMQAPPMTEPTAHAYASATVTAAHAERSAEVLNPLLHQLEAYNATRAATLARVTADRDAAISDLFEQVKTTKRFEDTGPTDQGLYEAHTLHEVLVCLKAGLFDKAIVIAGDRLIDITAPDVAIKKYNSNMRAAASWVDAGRGPASDPTVRSAFQAAVDAKLAETVTLLPHRIGDQKMMPMKPNVKKSQKYGALSLDSTSRGVKGKDVTTNCVGSSALDVGEGDRRRNKHKTPRATEQRKPQQQQKAEQREPKKQSGLTKSDRDERKLQRQLWVNGVQNKLDNNTQKKQQRTRKRTNRRGGGQKLSLAPRVKYTLHVNDTVEQAQASPEHARRSRQTHSFVDYDVVHDLLQHGVKTQSFPDTAGPEVIVIPPATAATIVDNFTARSKRQQHARVAKYKTLKNKSFVLIAHVVDHFFTVKFDVKQNKLSVLNSLHGHREQATKDFATQLQKFVQMLNDGEVPTLEEVATIQQAQGDKADDRNTCAFHSVRNAMKHAKVGRASLELDGNRLKIRQADLEGWPAIQTQPKPQQPREEGTTTATGAEKKSTVHDADENKHAQRKGPTYAPKPNDQGWRATLTEAKEAGVPVEVTIGWTQKGDTKSNVAKWKWWAGWFDPTRNQVTWQHYYARGAWKTMTPCTDTITAQKNYEIRSLEFFYEYNGATRAFFKAQLHDDVLVKAADCKVIKEVFRTVQGIKKETVGEHRNILRRILREAPKHGDVTLGQLVAQVLQAWSSERNWKATHEARKANSTIGLFAKLPLYTNIERGVALKQSALFADYHRAVGIRAAAERVVFPQALRPTQYNKFVDNWCRMPRASPNQAPRIAVAMSFISAGRFGDVCKVQRRDVQLERDVDGHTLDIVFLRGKSARLSEPHRVQLPIPEHKAEEVVMRIRWWLNKFKDNEFLFQMNSGNQWKHFYKDARTALREVDSSLELRSMRRGRLQQLATTMDIPGLLKVSGHKQESTLRRYLGWNEAAIAHKKGIVNAARQAQEAGGGLEMSGGGIALPEWWKRPGQLTPQLAEVLPATDRQAEVDKAKQNLHIKHVGPYSLQQFDQMAIEVNMKEEWDNVKKYITDPSMFEGVDETPIRATRLRHEFVQKMVQFGHAREVNEEEVKGYIRLFGTLEVEKGRTRAIKHPPEINEWITKDDLLGIQLPTLTEQRQQVEAADYAVELDGASFFDGFVVHPRIAARQAFKSGGKTYLYDRLLMGVRYAVDIAQVAMKILARKAMQDAKKQHGKAYNVTEQTNIDNVRFAGERPHVLTTARLFVQAAQTAGVTITQPDDETEKLWEQRKHKWLGAMYDLKTRTTSLAAKSLNKINASWKNRAAWSIRQLAAHYSLLFWATRILRLDVSQKFAAMKAYRELATLLQEADDAGVWDKPAKLPKKAYEELEKWTAEASSNTPVNFVTRAPQHTLFIDASRYRWGAVCWCHDSNEVTVLSRRWDNATSKKGMEHSTQAEPLAVTRALKTYLQSHPDARAVRVFTDSITARAAHRKGYAADYNINSAVRTVKKDLPDVHIEVHHIAGKNNPGDDPSRGKRTRRWSVGELAELAKGAMGKEQHTR